MKDPSGVPADPPDIASRIQWIRGRRVLIDADLARFYGVTTGRLNEQVRRNMERFPEDFAFPLTQEEKDEVVANCDNLANLRFFRGLPLAFTEHGAIMAASVLNTPQAVRMSVFIVRAFVAMRQALSGSTDLLGWLRDIDRRLDVHDGKLRLVVQVLEEMLAPSEPMARRRLGFQAGPDEPSTK